MSGKASVATELVELAVAELERETRTSPALAEPEGDWLCGWCHNHVANDRDRFCYEGKDEFAFSNPEGIRFEIITFLQAPGCDRTGVPTLDHTWFPGHAWSFCHCAACGQHLGWHYSGQHDFAGLIKSRIVKAVCVRN